MPELQTMESPKTAGFVNPNHNNRNRDRIEQEEKELEELEGKTKEAASEEEESIEEEQTDTEDKEKTLSGEEKSFKKRYGDLRRHLNDKESEWKDKFESLEKRLDKENIIPPKSDEDIDEWARQYPDVAGIVGVKKGTKTQLDAEEANGSIKESDVAKMSMQDFELQQDAITKAMRSGKFIYDLSGNAR